MKKVIIKNLLALVCLMMSVGAWAINPQIKTVFSNVVWSNVNSCNGSVSGKVTLVSTDGCGSLTNFCYTCGIGSGRVELGRFNTSGTWTVISTKSFSASVGSVFNFSFTNIAAGEYTVKAIYTAGGTAGANCASVTTTNVVEGFCGPGPNPPASGINMQQMNSTPAPTAPNFSALQINGVTPSPTTQSIPYCANPNTVTGLPAVNSNFTYSIKLTSVDKTTNTPDGLYSQQTSWMTTWPSTNLSNIPSPIGTVLATQSNVGKRYLIEFFAKDNCSSPTTYSANRFLDLVESPVGNFQIGYINGSSNWVSHGSAGNLCNAPITTCNSILTIGGASGTSSNNGALTGLKMKLERLTSGALCSNPVYTTVFD